MATLPPPKKKRQLTENISTDSSTAQYTGGVGSGYVVDNKNKTTSPVDRSGGGGSEETIAVNPITYQPDPNSTFRVYRSEVGKPPAGSENRPAYNSGNILNTDTQKIGSTSGNRFATTNNRRGYASSGVTEIRQGGRGQGGFIIATNKPIVNVGQGFANKIINERAVSGSSTKNSDGFVEKRVVLSVKERPRGTPSQSIDFLYTRPKPKNVNTKNQILFQGGQKNELSPRPNNISNNSRNSLVPMGNNKVLPEEETGFEKRVRESVKRQTDFFNSEGFKRIDALANWVTLGKGKPIEERSVAGQSAQKIASGLFGWGISSGAVIISTGEKVSAVGEGLVKNPRGTARELGLSFKKLEQGAFSFLPGGTPINSEGIATLGTTAIFAGVSLPSFKSSNPVQVETTKMIVKGEPEIIIKNPLDLNVKTNYKNKPLLSASEIVVESGTKTIKSTTIGLDLGSRGTPIISKVDNAFLLFEKPLKNKIPLTDLKANLNQPLTASSGKVLRNQILDLSPSQKTRVESAIIASRNLGTERGLPVKDFLLNIEGLKNPKTTTDLFQTFIKENKRSGKVFGSLVTKTLPEGYKNTKIGDIDMMFPRLTVEQIRPKLIKFTEQLRKGGEDVFYKEDNTILFGSGEKFLEAKSGINQNILGLGDEAPAGYLGFKTGTTTKRRFGQGRSIQIGEQLRNKGSGALIINTGGKGETPSFSGYDIIGKNTGNNIRGLKDVAGFIQTGKGIAEIKSKKFNPLENIRAKKGSQAVDEYFRSFNPEQRIDIINKLKEITGSDFKIELLDKKRLSDFGSKTNSPISNIGSQIKTDALKNTSSSNLNKRSSNNVLKVNSVLKNSDSSKTRYNINTSNINSNIGYSPKSSSPLKSLSPSSSSSPYSPKSSSPYSPKSPSPYSPSPSPYSPYSFRSPSPYSPKSPPNSKSPPILSPFFRNGKNLFSVDVKSKGKFRSVGQGLNLKDAIKLGKNLTDNSASRSFKIKNQAGKPLKGLNLGGNYYKKGDTYIEKVGVAISTSGELKQITFKGIATQKRKKLGII